MAYSLVSDTVGYITQIIKTTEYIGIVKFRFTCEKCKADIAFATFYNA